jgi:hypothetical protein
VPWEMMGLQPGVDTKPGADALQKILSDWPSGVLVKVRHNHWQKIISFAASNDGTLRFGESTVIKVNGCADFTSNTMVKGYCRSFRRLPYRRKNIPAYGEMSRFFKNFHKDNKIVVDDNTALGERHELPSKVLLTTEETIADKIVQSTELIIHYYDLPDAQEDVDAEKEYISGTVPSSQYPTRTTRGPLTRFRARVESMV